MNIEHFFISISLFIFLIFNSSILQADHVSGLDFSIGGRIKIDAIYSSDSVGGDKTSKSDLAFSPSSIPIGNSSGEDLELNLRESRIWATLHLPVFNQDLSGYVELDFFDTDRKRSGQTHVTNDPRLRHAYGTFSGITLGKTYTTFFNVSSFPEINDANGPLGVLNIRQEQLRFEKKITSGKLFFALEKPESTFTSFTGNSIQTTSDHVPDIISKIEFVDTWGNWSLSGMLREIRANNKIVAGVDDNKWGGAISAAGRIFLLKQNNLRFSVSYGNALGRYLSFNAFDDAAIDNTGKISLTKLTGGYVAYQHWWTSTLRSSFAGGIAYADQNTSKVPVTVDKLFMSSHINLLWSPIQKLTVGIEWLHGYRELENGNNNDMDRIQLSAVYNF